MKLTKNEPLTGLCRLEDSPHYNMAYLRRLITERLKAAESMNASDPWDMGFITRKGNVRKRNEDYGLAFRCQGYQILVVADGMGGPSHGAIASFLAVEAAVCVVKESLRADLSESEIKQVSLKAFREAEHQLAWMGDKLNVIETGLRTTLIVLIANRDHAFLTYIGDGAVYHHQSPTACRSVLQAHKAFPSNLSVLSASLGPTIHGKPQSVTLKRAESDLIMVMTDGLADRIDTPDVTDHPPELIANLVGLAHAENGNLQSTTRLAVEMAIEEQDERGYICDDNVSLGIMGNTRAPEFS